MTKLTFIGSGCWQGIPAPFVEDKISKNVKWGSKDFRFRTSLHIQTKNNKSIIVEITPDIRLQSWKFKIKKPSIFLVSHWHWDHFFGLLDLDWYASKNNLVIYGNRTTNSWFNSRMNHIKASMNILSSYKELKIDTIKITPFPVIHVKETHGFLFEEGGSKESFAYVPDLHGLSPKALKLIKNATTVIIDATYLNSDLDDDPDHFKGKDIIPFLKHFNSKEIILTNIGSYQGLTHAELTQKYPDVTIAYDGLKRIFK